MTGLIGVLPLKETVVFPDSLMPLAIGRDRSIRLVDDVTDGERVLALLTVRDAEVEEPSWNDLYEVGTAAVVQETVRVRDGTLRILVRGVERIRLEEPVTDEPYFVARFSVLRDETAESDELEALTRYVQGLFGRLARSASHLPEDFPIAAENLDDAGVLCDLVASTLRLETEEKQRILELADAGARLREVSRLLGRELGTKVEPQPHPGLEPGEREFFLRQQRKAIEEELGEGVLERAEVNELRERLDAIELPESVRRAADREVARLERLAWLGHPDARTNGRARPAASQR